MLRLMASCRAKALVTANRSRWLSAPVLVLGIAGCGGGAQIENSADSGTTLGRSVVEQSVAPGSVVSPDSFNRVAGSVQGLSGSSATGSTAEGARLALGQALALPRLGASDVRYLGAFRAPTAWPLGTSTFNYGGKAVTAYQNPKTGRTSLFMQGHNQFDGQVAELEVPDTLGVGAYESLPIGRVVQPFFDVTDGELSRQPNSTGSYSNGAPVYGLLAYGERLVVAVTHYYNNVQLASHGVSGIDLSLPSDFRGFFSFNSGVLAPTRALGGSMGMIPEEWRAALGGPAFTGNQSIPLTGTNSFGPTLTIFDPDDVGRGATIPGRTLLWYPGTNPVCGAPGCENTQNNVYNLTSLIVGKGIAQGSRTLFFVGTQGFGGYWYGGRTDGPGGMVDPFHQTTGPHSPAYRYQMWAYDLGDLVAVKGGSMRAWEPRPYATWSLPEVTAADPSGSIYGAGFDLKTSRLFITMGGNRPTVHVYEIKPR
jgi:hypothetical protein